ncbi:cation:proton antiporter [Geopsychrobacter electrodiphilus]|uniref:cation:proton antiporter domain-containing protein n=1 Tax=Geopsychrobacter electrodiphilus TaxID=225196 RepID=UPI000362F522|nr:cation:proton antiporter [Geopsychrobacter electrodiphilus]
MNDPHQFLSALTVVLCVAAFTTVLFQRLKQPVILGYILAGLLIGPHVPFPLVADLGIVQTLSEVGVILVMFSLGLEFSLRKLGSVGPPAALTALFETSLMMWLGYTVAQLFGWTAIESIFTGAVLAISSTTIVAKAFQEQSVSGKLREIVFGVLIVEDLIAILLLAALTAIATGSGLAPGPLAITLGKLAAFLLALMSIGLLLVPRAMRLIIGLKRPETIIISSVGLCFALALLANAFGYSVALGAFIAGSLIAESGEEKQVEKLVEPVRDIFAAVFFVSIGMLIDPALVIAHWRAILILTLVVISGKLFGVSVGTFLTGTRLQTSIKSGMSLAQIGEFSFIIAGLGMTLNATRDFLSPVAIMVSALTTLTTPWLIRASDPVANWIDHVLPRPLQTFSVLYGSWIEGLRKAPRSRGTVAKIRRLFLMLLLDAAIFAGILAGGTNYRTGLIEIIQGRTGLSFIFSGLLLIASMIALAAPFFLGVLRLGRRLGVTLAELVLPASGPNGLDLAEAPRRMLVITFEIAILLLIGAPIVVLTRPFLFIGQGGLLLLAMIIILGIAFWRSATNLQGHVRAGSEVVVAALARQSRSREGASPQEDLAQIEKLLPGLGTFSAVPLTTSSPAVGKTLAELNLRALTGASVLAITRAEGPIIAPTAHEILLAGDVLALTGTQIAIDSARQQLERQTPPKKKQG